MGPRGHVDLAITGRVNSEKMFGLTASGIVNVRYDIRVGPSVALKSANDGEIVSFLFQTFKSALGRVLTDVHSQCSRRSRNEA